MAFYLIAAAIVLSAVLVITRVSPVTSALWLIVCLFAQAALYVLMDAHLVAALQVLIYAGAIMVLILFVIMLLNLNPKKLKFRTMAGERVIIGTGALYFAGVLGMALWMIYKGAVQAAGPEQALASRGVQGTVEGVGQMLIVKYAIPFELVSVTLLVAIVGAVVMAKRSGR